MKVALFITCFNDMLFPQVGQATVRLLRRLGQDVEFPEGQTCCGQMHFNTGYRADCVPLVRRFAEVFAGFDAVVTPSPSCAGMVRHQHGPLAASTGDPALEAAVGEVVPRVYELTEFLVDVLGVTDVGAAFPATVTLHPTCHSVRALGIGDRPRRLLEAVDGLTLVDLPDADQCCGFGGTFAAKNADTSLAMGSDKLAAVASTGASVLTAADTSCLMHLGGMLSRRGIVGPRPAPGRDPRRRRRSVTRDRPLPAAATRRRRRPSPARRRSRRPRGPPSPTRSSGRTSPRRPRRSATKRARAVEERADWEALRLAGAAIKDEVIRDLPALLERLEANVTAAGGTVHWARDAAEANAIVARLVHEAGADEVIKVKSMVTQEIELNEALAKAGIAAWETDLAELIVQLGGDLPSHILVPAIHRNRHEIREIFEREMARAGRPAPADLTDEPRALAEAARLHLREKFLRAKVAISGANFAVAETGTVMVVESEGNGRMCLTLPETLITVMGIEKLVPRWQDLEVFLQLLPRSSTAERMNPYTSMWTGVTPATVRRRSTSCCWTTGAPTRSSTRSAGRRCDASSARPASTSARSTSGPAAAPTARRTRARSARSSRPSCAA